MVTVIVTRDKYLPCDVSRRRQPLCGKAPGIERFRNWTKKPFPLLFSKEQRDAYIEVVEARAKAYQTLLGKEFHQAEFFAGAATVFIMAGIDAPQGWASGPVSLVASTEPDYSLSNSLPTVVSDEFIPDLFTLIDEISPTIRATMYSEDGFAWCDFDATAWFEQAGLQDIQSLVGSQWRPRLNAPNVGEFFRGKCAEVDFVIESAENSFCSFDCTVSSGDMRMWLAGHRPEWLKQMPDETI